MKELKILKFEDLYKQQCANLIHDIINKRAPSQVANLVSLGSDAESQRLRSHDSNPYRVQEPLGKCKTSSNSFCVKGPINWNSLPNELQVIRGRHIFKIRLKTYLMESYSDTTVCTNPRCTDRRHHH